MSLDMFVCEFRKAHPLESSWMKVASDEIDAIVAVEYRLETIMPDSRDAEDPTYQNFIDEFGMPAFAGREEQYLMHQDGTDISYYPTARWAFKNASGDARGLSSVIAFKTKKDLHLFQSKFDRRTHEMMEDNKMPPPADAAL